MNSQTRSPIRVLRHAIADRNDDARTVLVGHDARKRHAAPPNAAARVGVGRIRA